MHRSYCWVHNVRYTMNCANSRCIELSEGTYDLISRSRRRCQCYHNVEPAREQSITPDRFVNRRHKTNGGQRWGAESIKLVRTMPVGQPCPRATRLHSLGSNLASSSTRKISGRAAGALGSSPSVRRQVQQSVKSGCVTTMRSINGNDEFDIRQQWVRQKATMCSTKDNNGSDNTRSTVAPARQIWLDK